MEAKSLSTRLVIVVVVVVVVILVIVLPVTLVHNSSSSTTNNNVLPAAPLITYNADAYTLPMTALLGGFNSSVGVPTQTPRPGGSFGLAQKIQQAHCQADVFVPVALSAAAPSNLGNCSAQWAIGFVSDEMVLTYSSSNVSNATAAVIGLFQHALATNSTADWNVAFTTLTNGTVKIGISNPALDPAGLRGWLVLQAAGNFYAASQTAYANALIQAAANVTGAAAESMIEPMLAGEFQFLFLYRSAATEAALPYLTLDRLVNLGDPTLAATYSQFSYTLPTGVNRGGPIILCMTIPIGAPHVNEAQEFVKYVVSNVPMLTHFGLIPISPPSLYNNTAPPQFVSDMLNQGVIRIGGLLGP